MSGVENAGQVLVAMKTKYPRESLTAEINNSSWR